MERKLSLKHKEKIKPLAIEGLTALIWDRDLLLDFLRNEESNHYAITGGDVIKVNFDRSVQYTYDNWSVQGERQPSESFRDYVARCKQTAINYIESYPNSDGIFFSPVMTSEITTGLTKS